MKIACKNTSFSGMILMGQMLNKMSVGEALAQIPQVASISLSSSSIGLMAGISFKF